MIPSALAKLTNSFVKIINYELVKGNPIWRFGLVLLMIAAALVVGKTVQFFIENSARRREEKFGAPTVLTIFP